MTFEPPAGPYSTLEALIRLMPKSLKMPGAQTYSLSSKWYPHTRTPQGTESGSGETRPYPHATVQVLAERKRNAVSAFADPPYREVPTPQVDTIEFESGTLTYEASEQDIESVTSVIGTLATVEDHEFVEDVDFTWDRTGFTWTGTGDMPDDETDVVYTYNHRLFLQRRAMDSRIACRAYIKAKDTADNSVGGRPYTKEALADILSNALMMELRLMADTPLVRPANPSPTESYVGALAIKDVVMRQRIPADSSESVECWGIDFTVDVSGIYELPGVRAILTVDPADITIVGP